MNNEMKDILGIALILVIVACVMTIYVCWWSDHKVTERALHESKIAPHHVVIPSVGVRQ